MLKLERMQETSQKKPKWLRRLEQESWQAELVISGLAIYGALQLPDLIETIAQWFVVRTGEGSMMLYLIFFYLMISANMLIFTFIAHFVLRTVWVGLVGLNSVFPNGINSENPMYSPDFMEKVRQDFPNQNHNIGTLDDVCSGLFAFSAYFVLVFLAIIIDIVVLFLFKSALSLVVADAVVNIILGLLLGLFFLSVFVNLLFNNKKLREKEWVKKVHYPLSKWQGRALLHVFYRPVVRLGYMFVTNINLQQYVGVTFFFFIAVLGVTMSQLLSGSSVIFLNKKDIMYDKYARTDRTYPDVYENLRTPEDGRILSATIESEQVTGEFLRVFVPVFKGEEAVIDRVCGSFEKDEKLSKEENRQKSRQFWVDCYTQYHRFFINDSLYQVDLVKHNHRNKNENGVLSYIPTSGFQEGKNVLRVEKVGGSPGQVYRTMNITFWFSRDEQ